MDISKVDRIIFTSDFLKVDDRSPDRLKSPPESKYTLDSDPARPRI